MPGGISGGPGGGAFGGRSGRGPIALTRASCP
jgi:hypothetical protein